jgi:hypothetical protein
MVTNTSLNFQPSSFSPYPVANKCRLRRQILEVQTKYSEWCREAAGLEGNGEHRTSAGEGEKAGQCRS